MELSEFWNSNLLKRWRKNSRLHHLVFWVFLILISTLLNQSDLPLSREILFEIFNVGFFAVIVYFNKIYIFPKYLQDKKFGIHLIWLLVVALVLTPIKTVALFFVTTNPSAKFFFIDNQYLVFLSIFLVGSGSSIYFIMDDWLKGQREKQELANQNLQSELKYLKSQINPHFLFNTLNSLYALTLKKSDLAPEIVLRLSEMMRYMLYECNEKQVVLEKEVNYMTNYLELEKLRHGKKLEINLNVEGDFSRHRVAPLLFIPFIENCFKHGLSNQLSIGFVNIDFSVKEETLEIRIENSKAPAMPASGGKKSGGIGLANVKRRLDLLYPDLYTLKTEDQPNKYVVHLTLDLRPEITLSKSKKPAFT